MSGIINISEIHHLLFDRQHYDSISLSEITTLPPENVDFELDSIKSVLKKFDDTDSWILPVMREGVFYGMISKSRILNVYRNKLKDFDFD